MARKLRKGFPFLFGLRQNYKLKQALSLVKCLLSSAILRLMGITRTGFYCVKQQVSVCSCSACSWKIRCSCKQQLKHFLLLSTLVSVLQGWWEVTGLEISPFCVHCPQFLFTHSLECNMAVKIIHVLFTRQSELKWTTTLSFSHTVGIVFFSHFL